MGQVLGRPAQVLGCLSHVLRTPLPCIGTSVSCFGTSLSQVNSYLAKNKSKHNYLCSNLLKLILKLSENLNLCIKLRIEIYRHRLKNEIHGLANFEDISRDFVKIFNAKVIVDTVPNQSMKIPPALSSHF